MNHLNWHSAPDGGAGGSGLDVGVGGGVGGSSGSPNAKSLFTNDRFTDDNWKITEILIDKILEDCMGSALFQSVKNTLRGNKITLNFSDEEGASYNLSTKVLTLGVELESNQLFHELWHLYQTLQESAPSFQNSTMNQELEAHYAQYLYLSKKKWFSGSEHEKGYLYNSRGLATRGFMGYISRKGNLVNQQDNDVLQVYIETIAIPVFRKDGYPTEPYDATRSGKSVFSNLNTLTKNCN